MSGFALNLDLTLYFEDLRKYSSIFVNCVKFKEVGDVEKHIKTVFKLDDNICLTNKKFLIPSCEDIQILQQYETLKVQKRDFFDHQIHKNKRANPVCDQTALNLIQTERTIDLSCRPKQSLKINICQNHCISRTASSVSYPESSKIQTISQLLPSSDVLDDLYQNQNKEKQRIKKKRHDFQKDNMQANGGVGNGVDILDMSVKKSRRKKYQNCFSTDGTPEESDKPANKLYDENANHFDVGQENSTYESDKKCKKRKKQSLDRDLDLASTCWDSLVSDNGAATDSVNRHRKNSQLKKCGIEDIKIYYGDKFQDDKEESKYKLTTCEDNVMRKKHKKARKSATGVENHDNKDFCSRGNRKEHTSVATNGSETEHSGKGVSESYLEEHKTMLLDKCEALFEDIRHSFSEYNCNGEKVNESINVMHSCEKNKHENIDESCTITEKLTYSEEQDVESHSNVSVAKVKRKRVRKHNKKKKRESKEYMFALGPILNSIITKPKVCLPQTSDAAKHVFFTDEDFAEEIKIPLTPPTCSQTSLPGLSEVRDPSSPNNTTSEGGAVDKPQSWLNELLELASCTSKPVIFHRSSSTPDNTYLSTHPTQSPQNLASKPNSFSNPSMENSLGTALHNTRPSDCKEKVTDRIVECNNVSRDFKNCNGVLKCITSTEVGASTDATGSEIRRLPDGDRPIPTNVQNITLTDYPIIDNVVADDYILFKVLKINENLQPGLSKSILAKVGGSTIFPEKISLQIMEGCEECDPYERANENSEEFIIELRWADLVEPRLFYP